MSVVVSIRPGLVPNVLKVMAKFGATEIVDGTAPDAYQEVLILQKHLCLTLKYNYNHNEDSNKLQFSKF